MENFNIYSAPPCVKNDFEAKQLLGELLGYVHPGSYGAEESVLMREPSTYSLVAEGKDTIVLKIQRIHVHNSFPQDVINEMIQKCFTRMDWLRQRVVNFAINKDRQYDEDNRKLKLVTEMRNQLPYITREAERQLIIQRLKNHCDYNEKAFLGVKSYRHDFGLMEQRKKEEYQKQNHSKPWKDKKVQTKIDYIPVPSKFNKLEDLDILRLGQVKDLMFPVYNYQKLIEETKRCDNGASGFGDDEQKAMDSVKNEIRRAKIQG